MPCYEPPMGPTATEVQQAVDRARLEFRHNSEVAQLLCQVIGYLQEQYLWCNNGHLSPELLAWWKEHQQRDATK